MSSLSGGIAWIASDSAQHAASSGFADAPSTNYAVRTLPLGIALLREQGTGVRWHIVMAGNVLLSAPALAVFAVAQKHLLRAVTSRAR